MIDNDGYNYDTGEFEQYSGYYSSRQAASRNMVYKCLVDKKTREKYKKLGTIFLILGIPLVLVGFVLFFVFAFDSSMSIAIFMPLYMITFFIGFVFFAFGINFSLSSSRAEKIIKSKQNKLKQPVINKNDGHEFVNESANHRYDAPRFDIDDRFSKKESNIETPKQTKLDSKVCPKCGYINPSDAKYCCQCGTSFETN